ncbi:glucosaminidase domain-containing protein [Kiloniella sp.]|uniref:glucosaminidase domain-containing protein n=1 Tax=Kiloniella sp. TaxID=1938587 RepID=UPI003B017504
MFPAYLAFNLIPGSVEPALTGVGAPRQQAKEGLELKSRKDLELLFSNADYLLPQIRSHGRDVPRIFLRGLPEDLNEEKNIQLKKSLFIRTVLPLILSVNETILADRNRVIAISKSLERGISVPEEDIVWLTELSKKYGFTYNEPNKLLLKLDVIPVSLALAQSIQESGWGTSRFAREGNALFGQRTWSSEGSGMVPVKREDGASFKVKSFAGLLDSIQGYAHNLNTNRSYKYFRARRKALRSNSHPLNGYVLAGTLLAYSEEAEEYVAAIQAVIKTNRLQEFDGAKLSDARSGNDLSS